MENDWRKCVLRADSREIIKRIPDNSIDFILTDPPYNLGKHSTGNIPLPGRTAMNNDVAEWDMVDFNPEEWADEFVRILKPTGNLFIFTSYNQLGRWYNCLDHKFDTSNFMIWHKTNPAPKIFKAGFLNSCEMIFTCWNKKHTWNFISQAEMHNFIESPICMRPERLSNPKHPTQKPIGILKKLINIASNEGDIIFDPFMGVGSTGVAALELNRKFIGVEIDKEYFMAAKKRIDEKLSEQDIFKGMASEDLAIYKEAETQTDALQDLDSFFEKVNIVFPEEKKKESATLQPIIKWAGGKEKELDYILPNLPKFKRYFEPFVGGGAVFTAINAEKYYINDLSFELTSLYKNISTQNSAFFDYAFAINNSWKKAEAFFQSNTVLVDKYLEYREDYISKVELRQFVRDFCNEKGNEILKILEPSFAKMKCVLKAEMEKNLFRKMSRMRDLEKEKYLLPEKDLHDNIETAIKSAVYMNYRNLYNDRVLIESNPDLYCALFLFIRNYAYSGMFRYNGKGEFNVPYGGIAYNSKTMDKKLSYYCSLQLLDKFKETKIYNMDFEAFLRETKPTKSDFVFLDPPYDSEFSTYAQNEFTHYDQERLANYMINECKAKWMLVIKNTDFIFNLYNKRGINIRSFEKNYTVSFMNRNDKKTTHLLITNY